jgi:hypothetical protein
MLSIGWQMRRENVTRKDQLWHLTPVPFPSPCHSRHLFIVALSLRWVPVSYHMAGNRIAVRVSLESKRNENEHMTFLFSDQCHTKVLSQSYFTSNFMSLKLWGSLVLKGQLKYSYLVKYALLKVCFIHWKRSAILRLSEHWRVKKFDGRTCRTSGNGQRFCWLKIRSKCFIYSSIIPQQWSQRGCQKIRNAFQCWFVHLITNE